MKGQKLTGSHRLLAESPAWLAFALLYIATIGIVPLARRFFEGFSYNVSLSSQYGDIGLILTIVIAGGIIKRQEFDRLWLIGGHFHGICAVTGLAIGIVFELAVIANSSWQLGQVADICHNLLIIPIFVYLLMTNLPVTCLHGTRLEKTATIFFLLVWFTLLAYDIHTGRLNQRDWMRAHGVSL